ncbi:hypothetical protein Aduo_011514 [Ancylostoma duodenale]
MSSFASFVSTDSFDFSADYQFGPITKGDEEVWCAFFSARRRPSSQAKKDYVKEWLSAIEGSSLRANHIRHKERRAAEGALHQSTHTAPYSSLPVHNPCKDAPKRVEAVTRRSARIASLADRRKVTGSVNNDASYCASLGFPCRRYGEAQVFNETTGTTCACFLYESALHRVETEVWLEDEAMYAFLLLTVAHSNIIAIDPLLIQTSSSYTISQYPIRQHICYIPLHMRRGSHWGLAVFDTCCGTICVYDSFAHLYNSALRLEHDEPSLINLWQKVTDLPLLRIVVAGSELVHRQIDGVNCGVFACIYAERLVRNLPTKAEDPTPSFLSSARQHISHCLRERFIVSDEPAVGTTPLPRIFGHLFNTRNILRFQVTANALPVHSSEHISGITRPTSSDLLDAPPRASAVDVLPVKFSDHMSGLTRQTSSDLLETLSLCGDVATAIYGNTDAQEFSLEDLVFFLQLKLKFSPGVPVLKAPLGSEVAPPSNRFDEVRINALTLVVLYTNRFNAVCAAVFQKTLRRSRVIVFDFMSTSVDSATRDHLAKLKNSVVETTRQWKLKVDFELIERIIATLRGINVIAQSYMSMYELYASALEDRLYSADDIPPKILMNLKHKREVPSATHAGIHDGRLNVPRIDNQVAVIYVCRNGILPSHEKLDMGLRVYCRGGRAVAAHHNNNIDALSYPLYFPHGEQSYVRDGLLKRSKRDGNNRSTDGTSHVNLNRSEEFFSDDDIDQDDIDSPSKTPPRGDFYRFILARRGCVSEHRSLGTGKLLSQNIVYKEMI